MASVSKVLDRSRDFAEVFNCPQGRRYLQDDTYFNALGEPLAEEAPAKSAAPKSAKNPAAASVAGDDQLSAQLEA